MARGLQSVIELFLLVMLGFKGFCFAVLITVDQVLFVTTGFYEAFPALQSFIIKDRRTWKVWFYVPQLRR